MHFRSVPFTVKIVSAVNMCTDALKSLAVGLRRAKELRRCDGTGEYPPPPPPGEINQKGQGSWDRIVRSTA